MVNLNYLNDFSWTHEPFTCSDSGNVIFGAMHVFGKFGGLFIFALGWQRLVWQVIGLGRAACNMHSPQNARNKPHATCHESRAKGNHLGARETVWPSVKLKLKLMSLSLTHQNVEKTSVQLLVWLDDTARSHSQNRNHGYDMSPSRQRPSNYHHLSLNQTLERVCAKSPDWQQRWWSMSTS